MSKRTTLKSHGRVLAKIKRPLNDISNDNDVHQIDREEVRVFMEDGCILYTIFYRKILTRKIMSPTTKRHSAGWHVIMKYPADHYQLMRWLQYNTKERPVAPFTQVYPPPQLTLKV